ncbi:MAG: sensor histidine kinase [Bradymonadia bacterium]
MRPHSPHQRTRTAFTLLTVVVALMGAALIILGFWSWQQSQSDALAAFKARMLERGHSINRSLRRTESDLGTHLREQLTDYEETSSYIRLVRLDGEVLASTLEDESGQQHDMSWVPAARRRPRPRMRPYYQQVQRQGEEIMEVWLRARPGRRGALNPQWPPGPVLLCVGVPLAEGLDGLTAARAQLYLSIAVAVLLLLVALLALFQSRKAAALEVDLERRRRLAGLGELAAVLAHEIRTPLAGMKGYAQLLLERTEDASERVRGPAGKVLRESERLGRLVDDLLDYARPSQLTLEPIDATAVVEEAIEGLVPTARERQVKLLVDATGPEMLHGDADRLHQAISNLAVNAVQLSPEGETVVARLGGDRSRVTIEILDRGPGIPLEARAQIFEPFVTGRAKGTGLGLAIVRRIADEHSGMVAINDRPDGGSVFILTLPRKPISDQGGDPH